MHDLYEDLTTEVVDVGDLGERVVVVFVVRGRGTSSGITLEQPLAQVITARQGKIVEVRDYFSPEDALKAVGLSE